MALESSLASWLASCSSIAEQAGDRILEIYAGAIDVRTKADDSPLTAADLASHRTICDGLAALTSDIPVLSEESADIPFAERATWQTYWLVDPLDGTKEFIKRNGEFTVNIALIHEGEPVLGVVYAPVPGTIYRAARGIGAQKYRRGGLPQSISVCTRRPATLRVVGSRSHAGEQLRAYLEGIGDHEIVPMGSSLKLCLVAEGAADLYPRLGPTSEWDTAAAQAVVEIAGGRVTDTDMRPLRYNTKESLLNPHFLVFGDPSEDWSRPLEGL
ncbi:MAG: 3'(2'),5'-bisphosphate nucleotidase CysQ [Gammaproteobacteria bacterium]